jgi:LmbE family N-acetylglucosaminyl deacetylase
MTRKLLAVLAHPDDESYGIGGTLARYVAEGVEVHVAIATDGAAGSIDKKWQGDRSRLIDARAQELKDAADVLGVHLHLLGYRDSGYIADPANKHPAAFINSDDEETVCRIVRLIREIRPQIVITHDETGGYYHPDHIRSYEVTTAAFFAAGQTDHCPNGGLQPYQPQRLYYNAFSNRWVRIMIFMMRLRGLDPTQGGRNKDIDYTKIGIDPSKITTSIDYRDYWNVKVKASAAHGSQGGGTGASRLFPPTLQRLVFSHETFIRVYPPVPPGYREKDLFESLPEHLD